ncbi:hypothetical protein [Janthinobacterium lividum]|uniref:hypothetical protein n=1 Tax=Janthinobacterium lividum TaxID=29581 RepID=UPI0015955E78|nr:hypothetical protein [Janthinobacterium lividum]MBH2071701.1 hypothetical protein [Burkholderiales bacterium]QKY09537.1 hypothetical protein G8765_18465 [Janthinobacterium lividum]
MDKDISTLLREIKAITTWSEPKIAAELGTSQPTVNRILNGQLDCKGSTLRAIIELHRSHFDGETGTSSAALSGTSQVLAPDGAGRQPPTTNAILDTVPLRAAVGIDVGAKP